MSASENFNQSNVEYFRNLYSKHKESIDFKSRFGNSTEKAFADTVLTITGIG